MAIDFKMGANAVQSISATDDLGDDFAMVQHMENSRVKLKRFSQCWDVGSQLAAFYPFRLVQSADDPDKKLWVPCMSAVWGHPVPYTKSNDSPSKLLHRSFLRSRCTLTRDGEVVGAGDLAYQFSRIAPLLVKAMKEKELSECAGKNWASLGQSAYIQARQQIEDKYDPKKMNSIKPFLGRLVIQCNTVCYAVALSNDTAAPIMETSDTDKTKTGMFTQTLSQARKDKLMQLANSPLYGINVQHPDKTYKVDDVEFLEVMYNFISVRMDKGEAGRADPQGIAASTSIAMRFPDIANKLAEALKRVPTSRDDIRAKLYAMEPMEDSALLKALQQYTMNTADAWHCLAEEDKNRLLDNANIIDFLRVAPSDPDMNAAFASRLGHNIGAGTGDNAAPTIEGLVGSDAKFDVATQSEAVNKAVDAAEQGQIPDGFTDPNEVGEFAGELEV